MSKQKRDYVTFRDIARILNKLDDAELEMALDAEILFVGSCIETVKQLSWDQENNVISLYSAEAS